MFSFTVLFVTAWLCDLKRPPGDLGYLAYDVFQNSMSFPFVLSGLGLLMIFSAMKYQRNSRRVEAAIRAAVPIGLQELLLHKRVAG